MFGFYVINAVKEMTVAEFIFCGLIHCTEFAYQKQLFFQKKWWPQRFQAIWIWNISQRCSLI